MPVLPPRGRAQLSVPAGPRATRLREGSAPQACAAAFCSACWLLLLVGVLGATGLPWAYISGIEAPEMDEEHHA
ncbi:MAG: hypothetical protein ACLTDR_03125 [Adlercreutzia equolifaciens]